MFTLPEERIMNRSRFIMQGMYMALYDIDTAFIARIAWLYYVHGLTQDEIAVKMGCSRPTVTRHLSKAKELGIVEIRIADHYRTCFDVEYALKTRFQLQEVLIVPSADSLVETRKGVAKACADYLQKSLKNKDVLGIAWGTCIYEVAKALQLNKPLDLTVIQLMGGLNSSGNINPEEIVKLIATKLKASGIWLNTPAIVGSANIKKALLSDQGVSSVLGKAQNCTKSLLGIGEISNDSSLVGSNAITGAEMNQLIEMGAVGNILGQFFDADGHLIRSFLDDRLIAVPLDSLQNIPVRIGVSAGKFKGDAILGALRGGFINVLITDEETAQEMLNKV